MAAKNEAMAAALKLQIDQISKEGSGDSEEEAMNTAIADISSSSSSQAIPSNNKNNIYMESLVLEMQRKFRVCRKKEVSILALPCRHLCLCELCDRKIDVCPLCSALKTASVQVARLFGAAIFEASKLKVLFLETHEENHPAQLRRTYTLTHSDITAKITLC